MKFASPLHALAAFAAAGVALAAAQAPSFDLSALPLYRAEKPSHGGVLRAQFKKIE